MPKSVDYISAVTTKEVSIGGTQCFRNGQEIRMRNTMVRFSTDDDLTITFDVIDCPSSHIASYDKVLSYRHEWIQLRDREGQFKSIGPVPFLFVKSAFFKRSLFVGAANKVVLPAEIGRRREYPITSEQLNLDAE
eukprot:UC1_evm1s1418